MVEFPLPGDEERNRLVRLYFEKYVLQPAIEGAGGGRKISVEEMDYGALCTEIAVAAGGMPHHNMGAITYAARAHPHPATSHSRHTDGRVPCLPPHSTGQCGCLCECVHIV